MGPQGRAAIMSSTEKTTPAGICWRKFSVSLEKLESRKLGDGGGGGVGVGGGGGGGYAFPCTAPYLIS